MAQPTPYERLYNFVEYATANPSAPYQSAYTDAEFNAIALTLRETLINLSLIQRDDGALKNGIVTQDSLSTAVAALFAAAGTTIRGAWITARAYALKDIITQGGVTYICAVAHTSGTFATDLAALKWIALNSGSTVAAANVTSTPTGNIIATNVDSAIAELESEKLAKASNLSDVADRATAFTNLVAPGGTMTGNLTFQSAKVNETKGASIASASVISLDNATGNFVDITGTTTINTLTLAEGSEMWVRFTSVLTLTHSSMFLVLPGSANITTAANDIACFRGGGTTTCVAYFRSSVPPFDQNGKLSPSAQDSDFASFTCAPSAGALLFALNAGEYLDFYVNGVRQRVLLTTSPSLTLPSGSTLGTTSGAVSRIWLAALYNSGSVELAAINTWNGTDVYEILSTDLITTVAVSAGSATAHTWYSTTLRTAQAINILGYVEVINTAGSWATLSVLTGYGPGVPLPGQVVAKRRTALTSLLAIATATPARDNSIPQITEGTQVVAQALTARSALNLVEIDAYVQGSGSAALVASIALFWGTGADAIAAAGIGAVGGSGNVGNATLRARTVAGSTSSQTAQLRLGVSASTFNVNGDSSGVRTYGGVDATSIEVREVMR